MEPFTRLTSKLAPLPANDIDTEQIIPARYLKTTERRGLGEHLFADWRYGPDGSPRADFVLNRPEFQGARVLLAGANFGCGSSREHAPWALADYGFRAVIATSFADIFCNNALKNGLLPLVVDPATHQALLDLVSEAPSAEVTIDLTAQSLQLPGGQRASFPIDAFANACLLNGVDELGYLQRFEPQIAAFEARREAAT